MFSFFPDSFRTKSKIRITAGLGPDWLRLLENDWNLSSQSGQFAAAKLESLHSAGLPHLNQWCMGEGYCCWPNLVYPCVEQIFWSERDWNMTFWLVISTADMWAAFNIRKLLIPSLRNVKFNPCPDPWFVGLSLFFHISKKKRNSPPKKHSDSTAHLRVKNYRCSIVSLHKVFFDFKSIVCYLDICSVIICFLWTNAI